MAQRGAKSGWFMHDNTQTQYAPSSFGLMKTLQTGGSKMRYCGMGTMIPRLKSDRFCCLRVSEIKSLFSEMSQFRNISNNEFTVKSALPAQLCSGIFKENFFPFTNMF